MALLKPQRLIVLAVTAVLTLLVSALLAATLIAPTASASGGVSVSNLVVRSITIDSQTKVATARGAVTCTGARRAYLDVWASQTVGRVHTAYAEGVKRIDCDGRDRFSIKLINYQGRLGPGEANVGAYAEAGTRYGYDYATFTKIMRVSNAR